MTNDKRKFGRDIIRYNGINPDPDVGHS